MKLKFLEAREVFSQCTKIDIVSFRHQVAYRSVYICNGCCHLTINQFPFVVLESDKYMYILL